MSELERMYDLQWEVLESGTIRLRQEEFDEYNVIDLHPEQIRFIARRLCGMKQETAELVKNLERKLAVLDEKIADLVLNDGIRQEIVSRCGDGFEIILQMDGLLELSTEYTGGIQPAGRDTSAPKADGHNGAREVTTNRAPANDPKNGTACTEVVPKKGPLSGTEIGTAQLPDSDGQLGLEV